MRVFLVAGEPSGDKLGAALMAGLKGLTDAEFSGVGGPLMQAEGMESLFPMDELSVMGIAEVLPKYRHLRRRLHQTARAVLAARPDVLITIDSPDFCLRVARLVKAQSAIRTVHYVAPSVWAWRAGRARKMARHIDHVLALLPFEPPYMQAEGMACDFVGHPVVAEPVPSAAEIAAFREGHGIGEGRILLVLPGSRRSEVSRLAPRFGEALRPVLAAHPDLTLVTPTTAAAAPVLREIVQHWPRQPLILSPEDTDSAAHAAEKRAAFYAADYALAASGTVSLELAAADTPMVIAYDANWLTRRIVKALLKVDTATLVNLVSETRAVPEFFGDACTPERIAEGVLGMMQDHAAQDDAMRLTMKRLGRGGEDPGLRAARAVLAGLR
ncbi:lipid-A-disaccharide synthase [Roseovarius faecimaris]|uniref:Lipid-A-disaccharide synthase n=1 Tax=Roseovarius faecimaris TaxID=2494550 RepID=A0A6I6IR69_9RHOB|nr:lipid-A-disaccharide synthase [Roseovarius faecimaris]QGX98574.1 lipid-A-disaccharide synthase [Roseovarius faecimaris]